MTSPTVISAASPSPSPTHLCILSPTRVSLLSPISTLTPRNSRSRALPHLRCEVALRPDSAASVSDADEDAQVKSKLEKVGSRVRVKAPMKMYHVPRVPEILVTPEMEGVIKHYVGFWKGKRITATYPFKVEFSVDLEGRGTVKFLAHLKEDEFDFIE
ncbi:hypothetical protein RND81_10G065300 [Saponaria officinalis]|uniref:Ferredoxin thioredoxin reductase alpha chain domain-containing protein n=1 Tax=Saponaria officinalis TaxID=3572 RepID=A0AAW1HYD3_SAPOF